MVTYVNSKLCKLQAINKKAVIWSIQEFNDWNKIQGPSQSKVRQQMEKLKSLGWQKEKRCYLEQRHLWILLHQKRSFRGVEIITLLDTYFLVLRGVMSQQYFKRK